MFSNVFYCYYYYHYCTIVNANPGGVTVATSLAATVEPRPTTIGGLNDMAIVAPSATATALPDSPSSKAATGNSIANSSPVSTRPKQTLHHNEPKSINDAR